MTDGRWLTLSDGVLVRRYPELDLSIGLIVGTRSALVVDTRGDETQGAELATAISEITTLPYAVVYTHGHFDHTFGTAALTPTKVWAHRRCADWLRQYAEAGRAHWVERYREENRPDIAGALAHARLVPPDTFLEVSVELDLGDRTVQLLHPGRGHTDHDVVVHLPQERIVFAGDLLEHGAPPQFDEAYPNEWPTTLDTMLALEPAVLQPGHGDPASPAFATAQRGDIAILAALCHEVQAGTRDADSAIARSPYPAETTRTALARTAALSAGST
ncbi:glyoxylase-like metal-dependent hydrolase (beta-lactamase superfamily II) [Tamaricihabitans halophyticus]|uniref:Glyoxylase-like metal-dependent hydrolase (Beta-lactamase superfamily II) n=1 Tax=Tamaricihabitans halophyticus TaxID=1262583 RepID=A0A4R2QIP3_9PSEU|nr:MBL fold metallo-hydrolase [Tamaricihabitans halophyticus]TCP48554.1 glyoxylase-like metal-dependent hydrolase (beta-lactamase superfamily II) [Tamaricihabitans halophyticus]